MRNHNENKTKKNESAIVIAISGKLLDFPFLFAACFNFSDLSTKFGNK